MKELRQGQAPLGPVDADLFRLFLHYQALIAIRYRTDLALVLLGLQPAPGVDFEVWKTELPRLRRWVTGQIVGNVRASDLIGEVADQICGVIMPNTHARNAMLAAIRLLEGPLSSSHRPADLPKYELYASVADFWQAGSVEELLATALGALEHARMGPPGSIRLALPGTEFILPIEQVARSWPGAADICAAFGQWQAPPARQPRQSDRQAGTGVGQKVGV